MDLLKKDYPYDSEMLDNILELIVETVCTKRPLIRIGAEAVSYTHLDVYKRQDWFDFTGAL